MRQMALVAFLQAQNCTTLPAAWRHPEARADSTSPEYYQHIARGLEEGKFDLGFFDDTASAVGGAAARSARATPRTRPIAT